MNEIKVVTFPKKATIVKDRVGVVKYSVRNLPESAHVYGYKRPPDPETAGEIISKWVTSNASIGKEDNKSVVISNILAIKHGCTTAKNMKQYIKEHPNYRRIEPVHKEVRRTIDERHIGPFGIKTVFSEETIGQIIQAKYTDFSSDDRDYPDVKGTICKLTFPKPRATNASNSIAKARDQKNPKTEDISFTMKRFKNVAAKVQMGAAN